MTGYVWGSAEADLEWANGEIEMLRKENRNLRLRNEDLASYIRRLAVREEYYRDECKRLAGETVAEEDE